MPQPIIVPLWAERQSYTVLDASCNQGWHLLTTWHAWKTDAARPVQLHYLLIADFASADALFGACLDIPELAGLARELLEKWPMAVAGFHRILLSDDNVQLTCIFGEMTQCLPQIDARVDAFLLSQSDWLRFTEHQRKQVVTLLSRMALPQATLCADGELGDADQMLAKAGFIPDSTVSGVRFLFSPRWTSSLPAIVPACERHAIVIGAGLAGSAACERLAARGWRISLIERHALPAQEASGNLAGIFMPQIAKDDNHGVRLSRAAFLFALRVWQKIGGIGHAFSGEACGVLQMARDATRSAALRDMLASGRFPPALMQWMATSQFPDGSVQEGGCWYQQGGWAHPGELCTAMLAACQSNVTRYFSRSISQLLRTGGQWQAYDENGVVIAQAPYVIIANGNGARTIAQCADLPLDSIRGQVTYLHAGQLPAIPYVLCKEGYVTPPYRGICSVGASYDADTDTALRIDSQQGNMTRLDAILPGSVAADTPLPLQGRVGFRCVSADRMPLVGMLPDQQAMTNCRGDRLRDVPRLPGLYGLLGYASRGLIWAPLAAEIVAAQLHGEPLPVERELIATLDPARFILKRLRHQK